MTEKPQTTLVDQIGKMAKNAARKIRITSTAEKNTALKAIANEILQARGEIKHANAKDLQRGKENSLASAYLDRLELTDERIDLMAEGIQQIAALPDPVGEITSSRQNEKGLRIGRMRVPLGVIGIIYESRPNVTADAAALCLKSGNAAILRGGSEAIESNKAIMQAIRKGLTTTGLTEEVIQFVPETGREHVAAMLAADDYIDVIIPRGGKSLVSLISKTARMPVIKHLDGICHIFVDQDADLAKAWRVCDNGKTYRYGICGATETLLIHEKIAPAFLPTMAETFRRKGVEIRGCEKVCQLLTETIPASFEDWSTEYLAPVISIKIVPNYQAAVDHIEQFSSKHTDAIITENFTIAQKFLREVDSSSVMINTPTCFADGYEYGLGAEIGISTDKIHWRGPVGLVGLTCEKFVISSDGVTR